MPAMPMADHDSGDVAAEQRAGADAGAETIGLVEVALGGLAWALASAAIALWLGGQVSTISVLVMSLPIVNAPITWLARRRDVIVWESIRAAYNLMTGVAIYLLADGFLHEFWAFGFLGVASSSLILVVRTRRLVAGLVVSAVGGVVFLAAGVAGGARVGSVVAIVIAIVAAGGVVSTTGARLVALADRLHDAHVETRDAERRATSSHDEVLQILRSIPESVHVVAPDGRTVFLNERLMPTSRRLTGGGDDVTAPWERFALVRRGTDEPYPRDALPVTRALAGRPGSADDLDLLLRIDGHVVRRSLTSSATPILGADGSVLYAIATYQDVTERLEVQSDRLQSQKLESVGRLAAGIAHEINTPMQYIGDNAHFLERAIGNVLVMIDRYAELVGRDTAMRDEAESAARTLKVGLLRDRIPEAIRSTIEGVETVSTIVAAMKEFSHPGLERKQYTDLNRAIETVRTVSRSEWRYAADVDLDLDEDLPLVPCVPGEIDQVLLNLIVNAAHAITDAGDGHRRGVIAVRTALAGTWAEVTVSDTGGGIPEAIRDKVFDAFFTTKDVGRGTGQGLAIAHDIVVDQHGGTIDFDVEPGVGTTFTIRLPIDDRSTADATDVREPALA